MRAKNHFKLDLKKLAVDQIENSIELESIEQIKEYLKQYTNNEIVAFDKPIHADFVYWSTAIGNDFCIAYDDPKNDDLCYVYAIMKEDAPTEIKNEFYAAKDSVGTDYYILIGAGYKEGVGHIE